MPELTKRHRLRPRLWLIRIIGVIGGAPLPRPLSPGMGNGNGLQMIDRLGAQLNEPMPMPEFLQDRAASGVRAMDAREFVLESAAAG